MSFKNVQLVIPRKVNKKIHAVQLRRRLRICQWLAVVILTAASPSYPRAGAGPSSTAHESAVLESSVSVATAGFFSLNWQDAQSAPFVLQESSSPGFSNASVIYRGPDTAHFVSGRDNGKYYFRVRAARDGGWSEPIAVTVHHHSLPRALGFFSVGLIVFAATMAVIVAGASRTREP